MNSEEEIKSYEDVYFDFNFDIKTQIKSFEYPNLVKFLAQWRKNDISRNDPLFRYWLTRIAPSCVYKRTIISNEISEKSFVCFICDSKTFKRAPSLIRHYKENHFDMIPKGIFGENIIYQCLECNLDFSRKEYLTIHKQSEKHLKAVDPEAVFVKKRNSNNESNDESDHFYKKAKFFEASSETNERESESSNAQQESNKSIKVSLELNDIGLLDDELVKVDNNIELEFNSNLTNEDILVEASNQTSEPKGNGLLNVQIELEKLIPTENQIELEQKIEKKNKTELQINEEENLKKSNETSESQVNTNNEIQKTQPTEETTQIENQIPQSDEANSSGSSNKREKTSQRLLKVLSANLENNLKL